MYTPHSVFSDPNSSTLLLWRYIDFAKLVHLLSTKSLFFPSAVALHKLDPFEGSIPNRQTEYYDTQQRSKELIKLTQERYRAESCVSCWHLNQTESIAMWKLYSSLGNGIAIQTTIPNFKNSFFDKSITVYAGQVIYIDYNVDYFYNGQSSPHITMNGFTPFIHKRSIYDHEREYRAIVSVRDNDKFYGKGIPVPVTLELIIQKMVVAPLTPDWTFDLIKSEVHSVLPNVAVEHSIFDEKPWI